MITWQVSGAIHLITAFVKDMLKHDEHWWWKQNGRNQSWRAPSGGMVPFFFPEQTTQVFCFNTKRACTTFCGGMAPGKCSLNRSEVCVYGGDRSVDGFYSDWAVDTRNTQTSLSDGSYWYQIGVRLQTKFGSVRIISQILGGCFCFSF